MFLLQYDWAAEHMVSFPSVLPVLQAMIYTLEYFQFHSGKEKADLIPATICLQPGRFGIREDRSII